MKKIIAIMLIAALMPTYSALAISKNEPFKKLSSAMDNIGYGLVEIPDTNNQTGTKGSPAFSDCTDSTKDDVGRGIARVVGGLWELLTFWYPTD